MKAKHEGEPEAFTKRDAAASFKDMTCDEAKMPTRIYHQFFHIAEKRAARFTTVNHAIANTFSWAIR